MLYHAIVRRKTIDTFHKVQCHEYEAVLKDTDTNVTHHFAGNQSLVGLATTKKPYETGLNG